MVVHPASNRLVVIGSDHGALPLSKASESSEDAMDVDGSGNTLALLSSSSLVDKPEQKNDKSKADENEEREEEDDKIWTPSNPSECLHLHPSAWASRAGPEQLGQGSSSWQLDLGLGSRT